MSLGPSNHFLIKSSTIWWIYWWVHWNWWTQTQTHDLTQVLTEFRIKFSMFQNLFLQSLSPFGQLKILRLILEFGSNQSLFDQIIIDLMNLLMNSLKLKDSNTNWWFNSCLSWVENQILHTSKPISTKFELIWTTQNFEVKSWVWGQGPHFLLKPSTIWMNSSTNSSNCWS